MTMFIPTTREKNIVYADSRRKCPFKFQVFFVFTKIIRDKINIIMT